MDDNRFPNNIVYPEALVVEGRPGIALITEKRRHIAGMIRMQLSRTGIVAAGLGKVIGTIPEFMDMQGLEIT